MKELTDGQIFGWMGILIGRWTDEWMDGWMDGWIDGWVGGLIGYIVGGWMCSCSMDGYIDG